MSNQAKIEYKKIVEKIRSIVNKYDPSFLEPGISGSNTPDDEYDTEVARIVGYLIHNQEDIKLKPELLINEINKIWQEYFDENCKDVEKIAAEIIKTCT